MKLTDVIDQCLRELGIKEEDIVVARKHALAKACPGKPDINREIPDELVQDLKAFIFMIMLRFSVDREFRKKCIDDIKKSHQNN